MSLATHPSLDLLPPLPHYHPTDGAREDSRSHCSGLGAPAPARRQRRAGRARGGWSCPRGSRETKPKGRRGSNLAQTRTGAVGAPVGPDAGGGACQLAPAVEVGDRALLRPACPALRGPRRCAVAFGGRSGTKRAWRFGRGGRGGRGRQEAVEEAGPGDAGRHRAPGAFTGTGPGGDGPEPRAAAFAEHGGARGADARLGPAAEGGEGGGGRAAVPGGRRGPYFVRRAAGRGEMGWLGTLARCIIPSQTAPQGPKVPALLALSIATSRAHVPSLCPRRSTSNPASAVCGSPSGTLSRSRRCWPCPGGGWCWMRRRRWRRGYPRSRRWPCGSRRPTGGASRGRPLAGVGSLTSRANCRSCITSHSPVRSQQPRQQPSFPPALQSRGLGCGLSAVDAAALVSVPAS